MVREIMMAVIITNRDMPNKCVSCWHNFNCEYWEQTVEGYKNKNCPLKSTDEMKKDLKKVCNNFGLSIVDMVHMMNEIIDKYCDKEN